MSLANVKLIRYLLQLGNPEINLCRAVRITNEMMRGDCMPEERSYEDVLLQCTTKKCWWEGRIRLTKNSYTISEITCPRCRQKSLELNQQGYLEGNPGKYVGWRKERAGDRDIRNG